MAKYLISFPSAAMNVPDSEWEAHAVIREAKEAGVYVFGGGIDETVPPVLVSANGSVAEGGYPWAPPPPLNGGFTVLELPSNGPHVSRKRVAKITNGNVKLGDVASASLLQIPFLTREPWSAPL
jgi:hypothetical protein